MLFAILFPQQPLFLVSQHIGRAKLAHGHVDVRDEVIRGDGLVAVENAQNLANVFGFEVSNGVHDHIKTVDRHLAGA